jgi:hypothetical protein
MHTVVILFLMDFNLMCVVFRYLLCILTTYVMKNPPEVEEALKLIQQLRSTKMLLPY